MSSLAASRSVSTLQIAWSRENCACSRSDRSHSTIHGAYRLYASGKANEERAITLRREQAGAHAKHGCSPRSSSASHPRRRRRRRRPLEARSTGAVVRVQRRALDPHPVSIRERLPDPHGAGEQRNRSRAQRELPPSGVAKVNVITSTPRVPDAEQDRGDDVERQMRECEGEWLAPRWDTEQVEQPERGGDRRTDEADADEPPGAVHEPWQVTGPGEGENVEYQRRRERANRQRRHERVERVPCGTAQPRNPHPLVVPTGGALERCGRRAPDEQVACPSTAALLLFRQEAIGRTLRELGPECRAPAGGGAG
jgi:hypothetical protein